MVYRVLIAVVLFCSSAWARLDVAFTPSVDCEQRIVDLINQSREKIDVAVYALNNTQIVDALKKAHDRGVVIRILTDRLQASGKSSKVRDLYQAGINLKVHSVYKIEHNKFAVFDGEKMVTGSYNWTNPATQKNSENCLFVFDDERIIGAYQRRFDELWALNSQKKSEAWFQKNL